MPRFVKSRLPVLIGLDASIRARKPCAHHTFLKLASEGRRQKQLSQTHLREKPKVTMKGLFQLTEPHLFSDAYKELTDQTESCRPAFTGQGI